MIELVRQLIALDARLLKTLLTFSLAVSALSLVLPITAQILINYIAFANLLEPILVLCVVVLMVMMTQAYLRIYQVRLVECMQCHIFHKISFDFIEKIVHVQLGAFTTTKASEYANYFFDVVVVQKSISSLMISGLGVLLRAFFGMILLASYHPYLLFFDLVLMVSIFLVFYLPFKKCVYSALEECSAKHKVGNWLEQVISQPLWFKLQERLTDANSEMDEYLVDYLTRRGKHFSYTIKQLFNLYIISAFATVCLFGLGAYLLIISEITLGQMVSSEITLGMILYSAIAIGHYLDDIYDGIGSISKIKTFLEIPQEQQNDLNSVRQLQLQSIRDKALVLHCRELVLPCEKDKQVVTSFSVTAGNKLAIYTHNKQVVSSIINMITGSEQKGAVFFDAFEMHKKDLVYFRRYVSVLNGRALLPGKLAYDLNQQTMQIGLNDVEHLLALFNLNNYFHAKQVVNTIITEIDCELISLFDIKCLNLIKVLLRKPKLLILNDYFDSLTREQVDIIVRGMDTFAPDLMTIIFTKINILAEHFERSITL